MCVCEYTYKIKLGGQMTEVRKNDEKSDFSMFPPQKPHKFLTALTIPLRTWLKA